MQKDDAYPLAQLAVELFSNALGRITEVLLDIEIPNDDEQYWPYDGELELAEARGAIRNAKDLCLDEFTGLSDLKDRLRMYDVLDLGTEVQDLSDELARARLEIDSLTAQNELLSALPFIAEDETITADTDDLPQQEEISDDYLARYFEERESLTTAEEKNNWSMDNLPAHLIDSSDDIPFEITVGPGDRVYDSLTKKEATVVGVIYNTMINQYYIRIRVDGVVEFCTDTMIEDLRHLVTDEEGRESLGGACAIERVENSTTATSVTDLEAQARTWAF